MDVIREGSMTMSASIVEPRLLRYISQCEGHVCTEVAFVSIQCLNLWLQDEKHAKANPQVIPAQILELLLKFGKENQGDRVSHP